MPDGDGHDASFAPTTSRINQAQPSPEDTISRGGLYPSEELVTV